MGDSDLMTAEEAAAYVRVNRRTLLKWAREGRVAYGRTPADPRRAPYLFRRADLDKAVGLSPTTPAGDFAVAISGCTSAAGGDQGGPIAK